jgi:serine/threonine protein kinase
VRLLGHHELLIRLASGGAANVFLVRDSSAAPPGRLLALKILLPSLAANEDFLNMFFTEAKIAARLEHQNIVAIAGFGQVEGIHCLAMEYVFGASLAQVLRASARAKKPLTVGVLLRITAAVCDALHYAHELKDENSRSMGLVHRDVTPQNILIGFNGVPKLTDFGIAKATNRGWETQAGIVKGKFSYMSPEQALGKKVDRRSDIFGTGIVLWEALTGRDLFRGTSPLEVLTAIREQKIEPPSKVVPGLTPIVDPIVMKALRRSPRQRYQTALEMKSDIEELIERAGVTIDAGTISREFAAIYGDEIVDRAFALRAAMAGKPDLDHLANVLGGTKLNPKHLPVIPGGVTNPDPLGLFSEPSPSAAKDETKNGASSLPARTDQPFRMDSGAPAELEIDDVEIVESQEPAIEIAEIQQFEADLPKARPIEEEEAPQVKGWDDSTSMSVPDDELLSMLSEDDATVGYLPEAFAERFGKELKKALEEGGEGGFDDEQTVGMPNGPDIAKLRALKPDHTPTPWAPEPINVRRFDVGVGNITTEPSGAVRSVRPIPRAPSLDLERKKRPDPRPVPRAPSLDMESGFTPPPQLEEGPATVRARQSPVQLRGPLISFNTEESSESDVQPRPKMISAETDSGPIPAVLEESSPEPTSPGVTIDDGTSFDDKEVQELAVKMPPPIAGTNGAPAHAESSLADSGDITSDHGPPSGSQPALVVPSVDELPPEFPEALAALEAASLQQSPAQSLAPDLAPQNVLAPRSSHSTHLRPGGVQLSPLVMFVMVLGLIALGISIGILLTKNG